MVEAARAGVGLSVGQGLERVRQLATVLQKGGHVRPLLRGQLEHL